MKKLSAFFVILALLFAVNSNSFSQPKFTINLIGGYSLPLPDLKGDFPGTFAGFIDTNASADVNSTYLIKNGFNFGLVGKYAIGKKGNFRITGGGNYHIFNQKEDYSDTLAGSFTLENKINILDVFLGVEWAFMPKRSKGKIVNPFLGLDLTGNFTSGKVETTGDTTITNDRKSESRFGLAVGGGIDLAFSKSIGAVIGLKYNLANLINKEFDSVTTVGAEIPLNDKEHTRGGTTIDAKNISFIQFYAGVSFYLGQPKARVRK
ncbi:MAG: outer membrane beta-barrel protein [Ignavibacteria bacterium]